MVYCDVVFDDSTQGLTVPIFVDNTAAIQMQESDRETRRTKHIDRRWWYAKQQYSAGYLKPLHLPGDEYQIADLGTKAVSSDDASYKLSIIEAKRAVSN